MNSIISHAPRKISKKVAADQAPIVGLHCSGASGRQWRALDSDAFGAGPVLLPDFIGAGARRHRTRDGSFHLREEAAHVVRCLHDLPGPAHLVGHSYGGGVALHIARYYPRLVRSLCIYEPTCFHVLNGGPKGDRRLFEEIGALSSAIEGAIEEGAAIYAANVFTDFWGGVGAWQTLSKSQRAAMQDWIRKAPLDFHALMYEPGDVQAYASISAPATLMLGTRTNPQTQRIAKLLAATIPGCRLRLVEGASHMGPFSHREDVLRIVKDHLARVSNGGRAVVGTGNSVVARAPSRSRRNLEPSNDLERRPKCS